MNTRAEASDCVVGMSTIRADALLLTVSETGYGRLSPLSDYRVQSRGGKGLLNYHVEKYGDVAAIKVVDLSDDVILISSDGILIRIHASDINVQSRYGSGVRVMRLGEGDKVAMVARVDRDNNAETAQVEQDAGGDGEPSDEELAAIEAAERADEAAGVPDDE